MGACGDERLCVVDEGACLQQVAEEHILIEQREVREAHCSHGRAEATKSLYVAVVSRMVTEYVIRNVTLVPCRSEGSRNCSSPRKVKELIGTITWAMI
jgi:hypothetical protein